MRRYVDMEGEAMTKEEKLTDRRYRKAWEAVFAATHRLRALIEKDGGKLQVDFKIKGPRAKKIARKGRSL
jgi:hypothetical protein